MELGTATATPGELSHGYLEVTDLPTGGAERLPVTVAEGEADGPTLWVTGSIHGNEITGLAVAQDVLTEDLVRDLAGTVVVMPNLNPAGLRRNARESYYRGDDPNRYFPGDREDDDRVRPPGVQELVDRRVYDRVVETADAAVCLHTSYIRSRPFTIRGRVPYGDRREEAAARDVAATLDDLVTAFGVPVVNQFPPAEYEELSLNRSLAGSLRDVEGIPAFTPELGGHGVVADEHRRAGVVGVRNVMRELDVLTGDPVANEAAPEDPVDYPVHRARGPHTDTAGVVRYRVDAGDVLAAGDPVADICTPHGEVETTVEAEADGYVVGRTEGAVAYENDPLLSLAVRDEHDLVVDVGGEE